MQDTSEWKSVLQLVHFSQQTNDFALYLRVAIVVEFDNAWLTGLKKDPVTTLQTLLHVSDFWGFAIGAISLD